METATMEAVKLETGNSFMDDLLDFINEEEEQSLGIQHSEGFMIESTDQANYFARRLREIREEKSQAEGAAKAQIETYTDRVSQWLNNTIAPIEYEEQRLLTMLEQFAAQQLDGSSKKSIKLVEGTLQFRKQPAAYDYDDAVLLDHVRKNHQGFVKVKESVDKTELKKAITIKNGKAYIGDNVVPGIIIEERQDKFDVK